MIVRSWQGLGLMGDHRFLIGSDHAHLDLARRCTDEGRVGVIGGGIVRCLRIFSCGARA